MTRYSLRDARSALVKLYVVEPGTERLLQLVTAPAYHRFAVLSLTQAEFYSAVRRRERDGDIDGETAAEVLERFAHHSEARFLRQNVSDTVIDTACELINRYPLRAYDAIQLAGCLVLRSAISEAPIFTCSDQRLLVTARGEGLESLDPTV